MDKEKYLVDLEHYLNQLPEDERKRIIVHYEQVITDAQLVDQKEIEEYLGTARQLSNLILADNALEVRKEMKKHHQQLISVDWHAFFMMIIAFLGSPTTYLVGNLKMGLLLLLAILIFIVGAILLVGIAAATVLGAIMIYAGIGTMASSFAVGMFHLGIGLIFIAFIVYTVPLIHKTYIVIFSSLSKVASHIYDELKCRWTKKLKKQRETES